MMAGYAAGGAAIPMHLDAIRFVSAQVDALKAFDEHHYLILSSGFQASQQRGRPSWAGSFCQTLLRPRLCCGWSDFAFDAFNGSSATDAWHKMDEAHPWMLLLQRSWLIAEATALGYSILSIDTDMHFSVSPLELVASWRWRGVGVLFQGDSGFPHHDSRAEQRARVLAGKQEALPRDVPVACGAPDASSWCACGGPTAAPVVNVGFVWARGLPAVARLFNFTAQTIRDRLRAPRPPLSDERGRGLDFAVWEQDVTNEALWRFARRPHAPWLDGREGAAAAAPAACHPMDAECALPPKPKRPNAHGVLLPPRWWVTRARERSVWLAAAALNRDGRCGRVTGGSTGLHARTEIEDGVGVAILPRSTIGRICGQRKVDLGPLREAMLARGQQASASGTTASDAAAAPGAPVTGERAPTQVVPCSAYAQHSLMGHAVQHAQFINQFTRQHLFTNLLWWGRGERQHGPRQQNVTSRDPPARPTRAVPSAAPPFVGASSCVVPPAPAVGIIIGTAESRETWLCAPPHEVNAAVSCPCCWARPPQSAYKDRTDALVGCRNWNPMW